MAQYAGGGGGTFTPPATGSLRTPDAPSKAPSRTLSSWNISDFFRKPNLLVAPEQQQQQQQYSLVAPARQPIIDWTSGNNPVLQQKQPISSQISKEPPASVFSGSPPVSPLLIHQQQEAEPKVIDQNAENAKFAELFKKRKAYEKADETDTAKQLTPQEWATLSPMQQALAQSNSDLSAAIKKDFDSQGKNKSDETHKKSYNDSVKKIFGDTEFLNYKGMNFAPNTIAFLDSRGIKEADMVGRTLDDFLSGSALVAQDTLDAIEKPALASTDPRANNIQFAQTLAKGQLAYQEGLALKLKQGESLLSDITSSSTNALANKSYGAALQKPTEQINISDVRPETSAQFDKYMEALASPQIDVTLALDTIKADLAERKVSEKESAQVWESLIERSRQATTGEGKWFDGVATPMRSPGEVAQALGVTSLKRRDTTGASLQASAAPSAAPAPPAGAYDLDPGLRPGAK